ncbi:MAG TPA: hypothetical protein VKQ32_16155 [Polyangia bacterium]|nr:hypothetical protein [Polyangia bacterium]
MSGTRLFELSAIGGPWARRLAPRRAWIDELPWGEPIAGDLDDARRVWTRSAFSEYASAAAFAEIAAGLLAAGAPIDVIAAASDFAVDEIVHCELAARLAAALGGAVALEVDLARLVRPPGARAPLLAVAERIVRTCCVGEALTVPVLNAARRAAASPLFEAALSGIVADEAHHAQLGFWFLDWAAPRLSDADRAHLAGAAEGALAAFAPLFGGSCGATGLGALACTQFDPAFAEAVRRSVVRPLGLRGIEIRAEALATVGVAA